MPIGLFVKLLSAGPWAQWAPVALIAGLFAWLITRLTQMGEAVLNLRLGLLAAALGLTFSFDDAAAPTTDAVPSRLWLRRLIRTIYGLTPWAVMVGVLLWSGTQFSPEPNPDLGFDGFDVHTPPTIPLERLALEGAAMAAVALALAALVARRWDEMPGKFASAAFLALAAATLTLPERLNPWVSPTGEEWLRTEPWFWAVLGVSLLATAAVSWDTRTR